MNMYQTQNSKNTLLNETNYYKWSNEMQISLSQKNLQKCIEYNDYSEMPMEITNLKAMYRLEVEDVENSKLSDMEKKEKNQGD